MIHHHRQATTLGLNPFANAIDDIGIHPRQITRDNARVVVFPQAHTPTRQKLVSGMTTHMHQRIGAKVILQVAIERQVLMRRRKTQIGVQQLFVQFPAPRWLRADEDIAKANAGHQQTLVPDHYLAGGVAPAANAFNAQRNQRRHPRLGGLP